MKQLNGYGMRLVLVGVVAAVFMGGGRAKADFTFGEPTNLGPTVNSSSGDGIGSLSADGLEMYIASGRPGGQGNWDIWVSRRATTDDDWGTPVNLGPPVSGPFDALAPGISPDGLELYFISVRPGGVGLQDIWISRRDSKDDVWSEPVNLGPPINSSAHEMGLSISADELELYFNSMRGGGLGWHDLYVARRATRDDDWDAPVNLGSVVNSPTSDTNPSISADGLCLFFSDHSMGPYRQGGFGAADMWMTSRLTKEEDWGEPVNLGLSVNSSSNDVARCISADGCILYFMSQRSGGFGGWDSYQAQIIPIVDFNGDGIVDAADMCIIVDHWGTDEPMCDIGPMPWGDGVVDVEDLKVLAEHLFEDVDDPTLVAHWPLDEAEGGTAHDSVSGNDDYVIGNPLWQPTGGMVEGALELDGVDDCLVTTFGVNPAEGSFSIFAWVKGGAPGQIVISEPMGADWLAVDAEGKLMTELKSPGRDAAALMSQTVIADGVWHRIGLVWDGSQRMLCVDGVTVAEDTQNGLEASAGGLYIGTGKAMEPGTYFSGLIDDVRIYNRVVAP